MWETFWTILLGNYCSCRERQLINEKEMKKAYVLYTILHHYKAIFRTYILAPVFHVPGLRNKQTRIILLHKNKKQFSIC